MKVGILIDTYSVGWAGDMFSETTTRFSSSMGKKYMADPIRGSQV